MILIKFCWGTKLYFRQRDLRVEHIITNAWFHFCYFQIEKDQERERCMETWRRIPLPTIFQIHFVFDRFPSDFPSDFPALLPVPLDTVPLDNFASLLDDEGVGRATLGRKLCVTWWEDIIWFLRSDLSQRQRKPPDVPHRREELLATRSSTWVLWWWVRC